MPKNWYPLMTWAFVCKQNHQIPILRDLAENMYAVMTKTEWFEYQNLSYQFISEKGK